MDPGAYCAQRCGLRVYIGEACETTHLGETEKIRNDGLPSPVLIRAAGMQAIATASGFRVDQRRHEIVAAEEPLEGPNGMGLPTGIAIRPPRRKTSRDARGGFERLLIERTRLPA